MIKAVVLWKLLKAQDGDKQKTQIKITLNIQYLNRNLIFFPFYRENSQMDNQMYIDKHD